MVFAEMLIMINELLAQLRQHVEIHGQFLIVCLSYLNFVYFSVPITVFNEDDVKFIINIMYSSINVLFTSTNVNHLFTFSEISH